MEDRLYKYTYGGVRVHLALLDGAIKKIGEAHRLGNDDTHLLGQAAVLAECLVANRKEENAAIAVTVQYPALGRQYTAIAEKDGRVRGNAEDCAPGVIREGVVLEITQKLTIRGDYSSIVSGTDIENAVAEYYRVSQQTVAHCAILDFENGCGCILVEQFPITCAAEEVYRGSADREWEYLKPFLQAKQADREALKQFDKYELTQTQELSFGCTCTRRSVRRALEGISPDELKNDADADGIISVNCKYCGREYKIDISSL